MSKVSEYNNKKNLRKLKQLERNLKKLGKDVLPKISKVLKSNIKKRWKKGIDSRTGGKMKDLKPETVKQKQRKKERGELHPDAGMKKSNLISSGHAYESAGQVIIKNTLEIGVFDKQSTDALSGNEDLGRTILALNEKDNEDINKIIDDLWEDLTRF